MEIVSSEARCNVPVMLLLPREKQDRTVRMSHYRDGQRVLGAKVNFAVLDLFESKNVKGTVHPKLLIQSSSTRTDANENQVKFCSQQNFSGASKLNSAAAFT